MVVRKSSGGSWCQCACREVPECSTGASEQAAASRWEMGGCRNRRISALMPSSLPAPPPAQPNLPTSDSAAFCLASLSHALTLLISSWSQGLVPPFSAFLFFFTSSIYIQNIYVQRLKLLHLRRACEFLFNFLWSVLEQHTEGSHHNIT